MEIFHVGKVRITQEYGLELHFAGDISANDACQ